MEEISKLHDIALEWGCLTNLMDKISNVEDTIEGGWPELIDMVADAVTEEAGNKDPSSAFFMLYQFLWRLYYRIKVNPVKDKFNKYSKVKDSYWIGNYDYAVLKWAVKSGFTAEIDNLTIKIPEEKLTDKQRQAFNRRCDKHS